jgi:hypothetical protein
VLQEFFPGIDFAGAAERMSIDGGVPLVTDMVLIGAMVKSQPDNLGMCYVPFSALDKQTGQIVKLPVMKGTVEWFENTALGTDMWNHASDWCQTEHGGRFHFAMNCGCGMVADSAKACGNWSKWQQQFNGSRKHVYGRTHLSYRGENTIEGLDISGAQIEMWFHIAQCLEQFNQVGMKAAA